MINEFKHLIHNRMENIFLIFQNNLNKIRTNRPTTTLLDNIFIEYYGKVTPIFKISNIVVEDFKTLSVTVFDPLVKDKVEKSILNSNLGLNPVSDGTVIKVPIPALTEERRQEIIKILKTISEKFKISIRNIRKEFKIKLKKMLQCKNITKDNVRSIEQEIQKKTDFFINKISSLILKKKKEILNF